MDFFNHCTFLKYFTLILVINCVSYGIIQAKSLQPYLQFSSDLSQKALHKPIRIIKIVYKLFIVNKGFTMYNVPTRAG